MPTLEVTAATVTIQAVVIGGKNMTVTVYDQMPTWGFLHQLSQGRNFTPLWRIARCPRSCRDNFGSHVHVLSRSWSGEPVVVKVPPYVYESDTPAGLSFFQYSSLHQEFVTSPQAYIGVGR